ncbi:MAG: SpoIID/LytB domain-containing protein [Nocardioides sp.]
MRSRLPALPSRGSWSAAGVVGVAVALLGGAVGSQAPAVTVDQSYWIPVNDKVVVRGHGYGHGHGMSQYGAYGAARQGLSADQIVGFYYPGTTLSQARGRIRVLISADTTDDVVVSPVAGLRVRDRGARTTYPLPTPDGVTRWRATLDGGSPVLDYLVGSSWTRWLPDGVPALAGDLQFQAGRTPLTLWTPQGERVYRGKLRAASPTPGSTRRDTVNVVRLDDYIRGVLPAEMPPGWAPEAVKAQALAARTYAAWSRARAKKRYYQVCDTTACQVYAGADAEHPLADAAVAATSRQVLAWDGAPAFTQFSSSSGGWTAAGSVPYLPAQVDPYDAHDANPNNTWSVTLDVGRLERAYPALGELRRIRVTARDGNGDWSGRVTALQLDGTRADRTLTGDSFRWAFGLRSTWFTIDPPR